MATYELLITSPTEIALNSTDGSVKEKLTLAKRPLDSSVLVQEARLDVLQTINLEELFKNLGVCAPLLNITYDAVNGTGYEIKDGKLSGGSLTTTVTELKDRFSKTIDRSITVMTGFKAGTESAVTGFLQAYDYLTDPDYVEEKINGVSMACKKFESIRGIAVDMHKDAVGLANTFAEIETTAQNVTKVIMTQRDMDNAKKEELTRTLNSLTTQIDAFSKVKESLDEEVAKYDKEYSKISNIIEKNSKQAFGLQLASAITSGACSLFSTVAGAFSTKAVVGSVINGAMNKDDKSPQQQQQGGATGGSVSSDPATKEELEKSNKTIAD
ncbi:MAG: hypothetical protein LBV09_00085, partial [Deferribacteraceae bacterium]|nr:hypothetical protein [Deferribacteraceae bacterium]